MNAGEREAALERARAGDASALGALLDDLRPYVRVLLRGRRDARTQARLDDSDLIQDAMLQAYKSFTTFRGGTATEFVAWLRQVVLHTASRVVRDQFGAAKRDVTRELPGRELDAVVVSGSTPSAQAIRHEQSARMAEVLARLPEEMQQVILARHADDLPHAEIAKRLGKTEGAVQVLYVRAIRRLRDLCKE